MKITDDFVLFFGEEDPFSNFHPAPLTFSLGTYKITVPTSEHAFMYIKAMFFDDIETAKLILTVKTPYEAKKLGRQVKGFEPDMWSAICEKVMYDVNRAKYEQNLHLATQLLITNYRTIVEASPYDKIWGIGLSVDNLDALDKTKWKGENLLGKVLMKLREDFYKEGSI